jgi:hypothetical protein
LLAFDRRKVGFPWQHNARSSNTWGHEDVLPLSV